MLFQIPILEVVYGRLHGKVIETDIYLCEVVTLTAYPALFARRQ
ncbi:hypothetical protein MGWOODY_Mmi2281 [hydrothermal vent metagenome]|uniref:Uncharacterized protein n=1 Tax=hydrothermal vent metagenome TaxID=652676 RepID=A0A160VE31_9ZZZZ